MPPLPNPHHTEYATPVIRSASPASTIGTIYPEDQTSFSDSEEAMSQSVFESKCIARIGLDIPRPEEMEADNDPILPRHPPGSVEEQHLFRSVYSRLSAAVRDLEDNEIFEETLLRGSQAAQEILPTTDDIDVLMRSMMVTPQPAVIITAEPKPTRPQAGSLAADGLWGINGQQELQVDNHDGGIVPGKRSRNGTRRN
ncbi:hypothetical protein H0H93_015037 [Arthromyces matolae]|nr:hypothetical protein H0H93_015037 [Arthromyces matolae]